MADNGKKSQIKYGSDIYTLVDSRLPDPSGKAGKILGVDSNGNYILKDENSGEGSSGGAVTSVNEKTGAVRLTAEDVGALPSSYQAPVDSTWSNESTNPIQNKVIKAALDNKVDKVTGKSLSTNDFTNTYKNTLDNLDTTLSNKQDLLTAGTGITIDSNNVISASGGSSVGWRKLTSSEWGFDTSDNTIAHEEAYYNASTGLVRFMAKIVPGSESGYSENDNRTYEIYFTKNFKPKENATFADGDEQYVDATAYGVVNVLGASFRNGSIYNGMIWYYGSDGYDLHVLKIITDNTARSPLFVSGFYYTEDVPTTTGGET